MHGLFYHTRRRAQNYYYENHLSGKTYSHFCPDWTYSWETMLCSLEKYYEHVCWACISEMSREYYNQVFLTAYTNDSGHIIFIDVQLLWNITLNNMKIKYFSTPSSYMWCSSFGFLFINSTMFLWCLVLYLLSG